MGAQSAVDELEFAPVIEEFCEYLAVQRRYSAHTVTSYRRDLKSLASDLADMQIGNWRDANPFVIRSVIARQHEQGLSGRSLARRLSALRTMYHYLLRRKRISFNPVADVPAPRDDSKLPDNLQIEHIQRLFSESSDDILVVRDQALFEVIYSSGLRLAEVVQLDDDSVDLKTGQVRVTGKGSKMRELPVGSRAVQAIERWLLRRPELLKDPDEKALFLSQLGRRLSRRSIQQRLKSLASRTGVQHNLYPHMLRHSFASHILESSGDLRAVQELLGHADISTTQIYTHLDFQHLARVYEKAHPRASKTQIDDAVSQAREDEA